MHNTLEREYEMKRDDAGYILGYQCNHIASGDIAVNQHGYIVRMLERYQLPPTHVETLALCSVHLEGEPDRDRHVLIGSRRWDTRRSRRHGL